MFPENLSNPIYSGHSKILENVIFANSNQLKDAELDKHEEIRINFDVLTSNPLLERIKYFSKRDRSSVERLFWLAAFFLSMASAMVLIYRVWEGYARHPIIVTFQSEEQDIDVVPFPALTICNMNLFPKSAMIRLQKLVKLRPGMIKERGLDDDLHLKLAFIKSLCNEQQSFAKHFKFANRRGKVEQERFGQLNGDMQDLMMEFIMANTQPCSDLIPLCKLGGQTQNCSFIFKPVVTDHGLCCSFNILPLPLLLKEDALEGESPLNDQSVWSKSELDSWRRWNYRESLTRQDPDEIYPWKQKRAGLPYGLSILVDPKVDDYFCPASDSKGVRYILHSPLEQPHVMEFSSVASVNQELLVEVHPAVTNADVNIKTVDQEKRNCLFGTEKKLQFYDAYTLGNCVEECIAGILSVTCNCSFFHLPGYDTIPICSNHPSSVDFKCVQQQMAAVQKTLKHTCRNCDPLCEDIAYNYETTVADLQGPQDLWLDPSPNGGGVPSWAGDQVSIIHFFFGSDSTIPKLRKLRSSPTDLIASTGGILGLCIGFSVLSFVEIVYFVLVRFLRKCCNKLVTICRRRKHSVPRTIWMNPGQIPVNPRHMNPA